LFHQQLYKQHRRHLRALKIAAVVKGLDNPYFIGVKNGIVDTAKKLGVTANVQAAPGLNDEQDKLTSLMHLQVKIMTATS
jgi:ABC-type sugar transport system substrate-binding protein